MPPQQHTVEQVQVASDTVSVLQITDTHLCADRGGTLLGMDTDHSLQAVIDLARRERPDADLVLATGDLADGGSPAAYGRLNDYFAQFSCPSFWLPGNHDDRDAMASECGGRSQMGQEIRAGSWQVVMLDSQIPGEVGGELGADELARLDAALAEAAGDGLHSLVVLHHHPVLIDCAWLDEQIVADREAFFATLDRYRGVRAVLWGHVHQEIDARHRDVRLLATPSTCVQFAPGSGDFAAEDQPPGYRWLDLHADGTLSTGTSRVRDVQFTVDLDGGGYL
ncbi:MAG: 3',5'-cyclic-AMP phosphodiesterase [Halioglobus sp.]|nr:3',5'-cyclic-AMP phosphodiesterase [Halioglobus sp.]